MKQERKYKKCKCGNKKYFSSKNCQKCHDSKKYVGQISRLKLRKNESRI